MPDALILTSGFVTNPGATVTNATISTGDSATVKSFNSGYADLIQLWTSNATGGVIRITSNRLHDNVQGIRMQAAAGQSLEYFPRQLKQSLYSVDTITTAMSGGGAEVDAFSYLTYYSNLDGTNQNLVSWDQIKDQIVDYCGVQLSLTSGATAGQYGGSRTLNQDFQNLKADYSYAWLGYTCASAFCTLALSGPATSNWMLGGPGSVNQDVTNDWFVRLSINQGVPLIPVVKANDQGATTVQLMSTDTATSHNVSLLFARLNA